MSGGSKEGLRSTEYSSRNLLLIFAIIVVATGVSICMTVIPDAFGNKHYPLIAFLASLPCIGLACFWLALKNRNKHTQFGQTRLFLDPEIPGIGGQLGGRFTIAPKGNNHQFQSMPKLLATLTCFKASGSHDADRNGSGVTVNTLWQNATPVFLHQSADGMEASFIFELPDTCQPGNSSDISWQVMVQGDFNHLGEFCRTWDVDVQEKAIQSSSIDIPLNFTEKFEAIETEKAESISSQAIPLKTDGDLIELNSQWLSKGAGITGAVIGACFGLTGIYTFLDGWGGSVAFILLGLGIAGASLYAANKTVSIKIDKNNKTLSVYNELFGRTSLQYEGSISSPEQFSIVEMGGADTTGNQAAFYTVNFVAQDKSIKLSSLIEGERAATALRDRIVSQVFDQERLAA